MPAFARSVPLGSGTASDLSAPPRPGLAAELADLPRRSLLQLPAVLLLCRTAGVHAAGEAGGGLVPYDDGADKFSIKVPDGWMFGSGNAEGGKGFSGGMRRALAWYPQAGGADTNVTVLVTNVGADYTKLGSFGSAQDFGQNLVVSMDRTYLLRRRKNVGPVQRAKLLDARERDRKYLLEYTVQKPEEDEPRHFLSAVSLGFNGRYNKLFTVTAQCRESELPRFRPVLQATVDSFVPPAPEY